VTVIVVMKKINEAKKKNVDVQNVKNNVDTNMFVKSKFGVVRIIVIMMNIVMIIYWKHQLNPIHQIILKTKMKK
jgi:hypothetical protein